MQKSERIVDLCRNVRLSRLSHSSLRTIRDNADRITESAKSGTEVFVLQDNHRLIGMKCTIKYRCESLTFFIVLEINKYFVQKCTG